MFFNKFICNSLTTKGNEVIIIIAVHVTYLHPSTKYLFVLSKATHHRTGNTIETNLKNLNVNQFDLAFEVSWSTCLLLTTGTYVTVGRERGHRRGKWKKIIIGKHNTQMSLIWVIVTVMIIKILIMIVMSQRGDRCAIACACSFSTLLSIRGVFI